MSHPDDPNIDSQLNDVPLPPRFVERLRAALQPTDSELDERLQAVAVPEMLTTYLAAIPTDETLAARLQDVPLPTHFLKQLRQIPYVVETVPRQRSYWQTTRQFVTAASLLVLIGAGYSSVSRWWFADTIAKLAPSESIEPTYLPFDGPFTLASRATRNEQTLDSPALIFSAGDGNREAPNLEPFTGLAGNSVSEIESPFSDAVLPDSRPSRMLDLVQREARLLTNVAVLRWGVFGARHDDRDENLQLEELPTPVLKGIEPPLSKGYNRPFWLKHHVLPPFSPSVAELQTLAVPLRAEIAGYDRVERQVAAGRKLNERELRVEDFVAQGLGYLPAAPSNVIQLRAVAGPSPFGPANSAMLQLLVQAGQFRSATPRHWVVAVDLSASMQRGGRWQGVKRMLSSFPERLGPEDRVSLVGFRDEVDVNLSALGPEDVTLWRETIRSLQPAGGADLFVGVREAVTRAFNEDGSPLPPAEIVIISDHEGLLTNTATRGMSELLREVQQAGHGVQLVDLSAAANRSPLQQLATAANVPRHGALAGSEPASALVRWWSSVTPRVAADVKVQVKFDPKQVTAYRLVGHAAGSWSHVSTIADPIDLSPGDAACSLVEVALHPGTEGNVAEVQLEWRDPQTGNVRRERSQVAKREFLRPLHETPPAFQRVLCAAELAEVLNGTRVALREANWSSGEPHDLETVLNTMRQLTSPARSDPAAVQLLQLTESLRRQGIK